ncbi:MAG TPA: hypothetical protein VN289_07745, partial [Paraburkholderia sp.]|nr:hypothetical protein [Paraburkholderia sp.]
PRHPSSPAVAAAPDVTLNSVARPDGSTARAGQARGRSDDDEGRGEAPLAWSRARGDLAARYTQRTPERIPVTSRAIDPRASVPSNRSKQPDIDHPAHDAHDARNPHDARKSNAANTAKRERDGLAKASVRRIPRATPHSLDIMPRHGVPISPDPEIAPKQAARHLPSIAGAYSPAAPSSHFDSGYGSVTMSAGTHVSDIPPATIRRDRVDTDSTDWMNHMSHRRITEAPDGFSK